jgi:hypothetical protein
MELVLEIFAPLPHCIFFGAYINGLTDDILISDGTKSPDDASHNYLIFPAKSARAFEYVEAKDLPGMTPEEREYFLTKHGPANLRIMLHSGLSVSFFEAPHK